MTKILQMVLILLMSTACNLSDCSSAQGAAWRWFHRRAVCFAALFIISSSVFCGHASAASVDGPDINRPSDDAQIIYRLSSSLAQRSLTAGSANNSTQKLDQKSPQEVNQKLNKQVTNEQHLDAAKQALVSFRDTANPRLLGDAERELTAIANDQRSANFYFYRASLRQSLHLFSEALSDLNTISAMKADNLESLMMRFTITFVTGQYQAAGKACTALKDYENNLYAVSCAQQLQAVIGDPNTAYLELRKAMAEFGVLSDRQALIWASGTLADIAERAGRDDARALWQLVLQLNRGDLYTRSRLASLLLAQGDYQQVMSLTEDYIAVDALAVTRAIAQQQLNEGDVLINLLRERFDEALWRGEILHKRAYAQFLLDIEGRPEDALAMAEKNWAHQREWPDALILSRARQAVKRGLSR